MDIAEEPGPKPGEDDEAWQQRLRENERRLQRLNGRIEALNRVGTMVDDPEHGEQADFLCECSRPACQERLGIDVDVYAEIHDRPDRYALVPGHEDPKIDRVVERRSDYVVVSKSP